VFRGCNRAVLGAKIRFQHTAKQLEQNLEADLGNGWVIAAFAKLIADESMLGPGELVEAGNDASLAQFSADKVTSGVRNVGILDAEDDGNLALKVVKEVEGVIAVGWRSRGGVCRLVGAEGTGVDVRGEV
jgi:hypothetical protein